MTQPIDIKDFLLEIIPAHPQDAVSLAMKKYGVNRMAVNRHIASLIQQGKVFKSGATRKTCYYLTSERNRHYQFKVTPTLAESTIWEQQVGVLFNHLPDN